MSKIQISAIEKEMANFNFDELNQKDFKASIAATKSLTDIKTEICSVWGKIGKYVKLAEPVPVVGKFITILAQLLDAICAAPAGNAS